MRQEDGVIPPISLRFEEEDPLYVQVFEALRGAIVTGQLVAGTRLPSTRALARDMSVSRTTTVKAYRRLEQEGYVLPATGSGTYVAEDLPEAMISAEPASMSPERLNGADELPRRERLHGPMDRLDPRGPLPFLLGVPALDYFPYRVWRRIERGVRTPRRELGATEPAGHIILREAVAAHLSLTRAIYCSPEQVVITSGAQEVFSVLAHILLDDGRRVLMEDPGYVEVAAALESAGGEVVAVPVDEGGMDVLSGTARCPDARMVYVTPSNQFPMGTLLTMERRKHLVEWARLAGSWIVEDDYDCEFRFHGLPLPAIRSLRGADECTIYVNTFSKILFPSLSLGFVVLPEDLVEPFNEVRAQRGRPPSILPQLELARFLEEGHMLRHIRRMRHVYAGRASALVGELGKLRPRVTAQVPSAGTHLIAWLQDGMDDRRVATRATIDGVIARPLSAFRRVPGGRGGLVLGFGGARLDQIRSGVASLRKALA